MTITADELKRDIDKYLSLSQTEDVFVTLNGMVVSKPADPFRDWTASADRLSGCIPNDVSFDEAVDERLGNI